MTHLPAQVRQLHLGAILAGVGTNQNGWLDPDVPGDASVNIDWYIDNARRAEAAKFDLVFIVDSPFITPDTAPHFLNRLEPLTLLSAVDYKLNDRINVAVGGNNILNAYPTKVPELAQFFGQALYDRYAQQSTFNGGFYYIRLGVKL
jgi:hypothetical protein